MQVVRTNSDLSSPLLGLAEETTAECLLENRRDAWTDPGQKHVRAIVPDVPFIRREGLESGAAEKPQDHLAVFSLAQPAPSQVPAPSKSLSIHDHRIEV